MSTIKFTFQTQALDFSPLTRGSVSVVYNDGNQNLTLSLTLSSLATYKRFLEVAWIDGSSGEDNEQANNYRLAFNRDYKDVGGTKNLAATVVGNEVTITSKTGTFSAGSGYSGNVLIVNGFTVDNSTPVVPDNVVANITDTGDCSEVEYDVSASGDNAPFRLEANGVLLNASWDGTEYQQAFARGTIQNVAIKDPSTLLTLKSVTVNVPRKLTSSDFDVEFFGYESSSDILVETKVFVANTDPLEYSLESDILASSGTAYQSSNAFAGALPGQYKLFIKDKYGCEISRQITVPELQDAAENEVTRYFEVMEGQSFIFYPYKTHTALVKKNYFNTGSRNEHVEGFRYNMRHEVNASDGPYYIQFKSSYAYHYITLFKCDGTKVDIPFIQIAQNLGAEEEYDCVLYPSPETLGQTWVYFDGGNIYVPNTTDVIEASPYDGTTPSWAVVDQLVFINGSGLRIKATGYDQDRGGYFVVDLTTASEVAGKVKVTYNKQVYNTFEMILYPSQIGNKAFLVIERAFNEEGLVEGDPWVSEMLWLTEDSDSNVFIEAEDSKNRADIVFQSGIDVRLRLKGQLLPLDDTSAEVHSGDGDTYPIEKISRLDFQLIFEELTARQVTQMNIVSSLGSFKVNGLALVPKDGKVKAERLGESNLYSWERSFGFGDNRIAEQQDEIVYSPTTGVEGGGSTGKSPVVDISGITLVKDGNGKLLVDGNGKLIKL